MVILSRKNTGSIIKSKQARCRKGKDLIDSARFLKFLQYCRFSRHAIIGDDPP